MENENHKIIIKKIDEEDIIFRESLIPKTIKPFRGTVSVYQVLWEKSTSRTTVRNMSCFDCDASEICSHGKHVGFIQNVIDERKENAFPFVPDTATNKHVAVLSDITFKGPFNLPEPSSSSKNK